MPKKPFKYRVRIHYSAEDEGYIAVAPELLGCSAFGETPEEAMKELQVAAELWLRATKEMGRSIPHPVDEKKYPGKMLLHLPPALQRELEYDALEQGLSVEDLIIQKLAAERVIETSRPASLSRRS
jgi:predicted RNase H-like HicB family nuclease